MPRQARLDTPGALHHIVVRGIEVLRPGKYPGTVMARSVLCYFGVRELGLSTVELARRLHLSQPAVSQAVQRGEKVTLEKGLHLADPTNQ